MSEKAPLQKVQPRFGPNGRLYCGVCWASWDRQTALGGTVGKLTCPACGAIYVQKPIGMSFDCEPPPGLVAEVKERMRAEKSAIRAAAKAKLEAAELIGETRVTEE